LVDNFFALPCIHFSAQGINTTKPEKKTGVSKYDKEIGIKTFSKGLNITYW